MKRFYFYSIVIHLVVFIWLYSTDFFGLTSTPPEVKNEKASSEDSKKEEEDLLQELIKKQIREKENRKKQVHKLLEKYRPGLKHKQAENFSDVVTSSDLDEEKINDITKNYFGNGEDGIKDMQSALLKYLETGEETAHKKDSMDLKKKAGQGESVQQGIDYEGSQINYDMPEHSVKSEANNDLLNRRLERLKVEEAINVVDDPQTIYPDLSQKQAKYAVLPEPPVESVDTFKRTQVTKFKSLRIGLAPRMNKEFVPDGKLDEWDLSQPMTPVNDNSDPQFSAKVYLAWDFDELFLAAEITDPYPIREDAGAWWTTNSFEVWFDALNRKLLNNFDSGCFQFWFAPYPPYFGKALGRHSLLSRKTPLYVQRTKKGYIVEAAFKTDEELQYVEGLLGSTIGFHFFVNTSVKEKDGYEKRLFWITDKYLPGNVHTYTWMNPNSWGDVLLTGSSAEIYLTDENYNEVYNHFGINELNRVVIQDADRNLDPDTRQYVKGFLRGERSHDIEEVIFAETENNSGKFVCVILSESSPAKQNDGILQIQAGEPVEIIYYDQYTPGGISRLMKKVIYTYYPVAVLSGGE